MEKERNLSVLRCSPAKSDEGVTLTCFVNGRKERWREEKRDSNVDSVKRRVFPEPRVWKLNQLREDRVRVDHGPRGALQGRARLKKRQLISSHPKQTRPRERERFFFA